VNYGLDTETFDSERFPHAQTFVREAIQNSLDARQDSQKPVLVRFALSSGTVDGRKQFLTDLRDKKAASGLDWPGSWDSGEITWLVVEDKNSTGLRGSLEERTGDFWNYWLNFGISNKTGSGRGGRGVGRVTFLIASGISTVIGVTRRLDDGKVAACGMSLLRPGVVNGKFMSSYAYLAKEATENIYNLYDDGSFFTDLATAFDTSDYVKENSTGLSLIIPYPNEKLTRESIIAAAIEHFAPAILCETLVVEFNDHQVNAATIDNDAKQVALNFPPGPLRDDPVRFLNLIRQSMQEPTYTIPVDKPSQGISKAVDQTLLEKIRKDFDDSERLTIAIKIPVERNGETTESYLHAALSRAPKGKGPVDLFFREGMCLPEVSARNTADVDLVLISNHGELATYLNFCEGKAHLGLIENKEVTAKLTEKGFSGGYSIKRMVRHLPDDLRRLVLPDADKPDASIFSGFFSIPKQDKEKKKENGSGKKHDPEPPPPPPPTPPPPPRPQVFKLDDLTDGFRVRLNPNYVGGPVDLYLEVAYSDGTRRPRWSKYDFDLKKLSVTQAGGDKPECKNNVIRCRNCKSDFFLEVRGFDTRRELVTFVEASRNA
jgi:hypothetical protein